MSGGFGLPARGAATWRLVTALALTLALLAPAAAGGAAAELCFPTETGRCISGRFLEYWQANGGLAQQGYPITDVFAEVNPTDGKTYPTQYFERARFELHQENAAPYDVLLGLLGREQFQKKYPQTPPAGIPAGTGCDPQALPPGTKCINERFGQYYSGHGGLTQQGYAISDAFNETSPTNGQAYLVQYFERARFEYHPENAGTPYVILLGLLGREQYLAKVPADLRFPTVYTDDFSDTTRWPVTKTDDTSTAYSNGRYLITASGNTLVNGKVSVETHVALPGIPKPGGGTQALDDVRLAVDATPKSAGGSTYGLSCRTQGDARYTATVSMLFPQQGPVYGATIAAFPAPALGGKTLVSVTLPAGTIALNHTARLQFTCAGPNLTLSVNGTIIAQTQDYALTSGGFGFQVSDFVSGAGAGASSGLAVEFDNLTVDSTH